MWYSIGFSQRFPTETCAIGGFWNDLRVIGLRSSAKMFVYRAGALVLNNWASIEICCLIERKRRSRADGPVVQQSACILQNDCLFLILHSRPRCLRISAFLFPMYQSLLEISGDIGRPPSSTWRILYILHAVCSLAFPRTPLLLCIIVFSPPYVVELGNSLWASSCPDRRVLLHAHYQK